MQSQIIEIPKLWRRRRIFQIEFKGKGKLEVLLEDFFIDWWESDETLTIRTFFNVKNKCSASIKIKTSMTHCTKKSSFPLRISSVNVTKSAGICGFGHIYCRKT